MKQDDEIKFYEEHIIIIIVDTVLQVRIAVRTQISYRTCCNIVKLCPVQIYIGGGKANGAISRISSAEHIHGSLKCASSTSSPILSWPCHVRNTGPLPMTDVKQHWVDGRPFGNSIVCWHYLTASLV
jgi:hypothetical protein